MNTIKKSRATVRRMTQGEWPATRRLVSLLRQLDKEGAGTRGTRAAIHRNTGLDQGVVSDMITGADRRKNVTGQTIEKVLRLFRSDTGKRLSREFFFGTLPKNAEPNYRDYLVDAVPEPHPEPNPDSAGNDSDDDDAYTEEIMLEELRPTPSELKRLRFHLRLFKYPRVDAYFKRAILLALRDPKGRQAAIDAAMDRVGDAIAEEDDAAATAKAPSKRKKKSTD